MANCLSTLGAAACNMGAFALARQHLTHVLQLSRESEFFYPNISGYLRVWAGLLMKESGSLLEDCPSPEEMVLAQNTSVFALEIAGLILHRPISWQREYDKTRRLFAELEAALPPDVIAPALERGQARDPETTVAELLGESLKAGHKIDKGR